MQHVLKHLIVMYVLRTYLRGKNCTLLFGIFIIIVFFHQPKHTRYSFKFHDYDLWETDVRPLSQNTFLILMPFWLKPPLVRAPKLYSHPAPVLPCRHPPKPPLVCRSSRLVSSFRFRTLLQILCEVSMAIYELNETPETHVTREIMPAEARRSADNRSLRDWLILREYITGLQYVIETFEYLKSKR